MRRFHAYNVGLPRTGTTSLAAIFSAWNSAHEYALQNATMDIVDHLSGRLGREEFVKRVVQREQASDIEMNSSSFNHEFLDVLQTHFPQARFVFTIRDCWSWTHSLLHIFDCVRPMPAGLANYARLAMEIPVPETVAEIDDPVDGRYRQVAAALAYWARANQRVLARLPAARSLVLRTSEIGRSLPQLADHVGVAIDSLRSDRSHQRQSAPHLSILHDLDADWLTAQAREAGCDALMQQWFPQENLSLHLERSAFLAQFQGRP